MGIKGKEGIVSVIIMCLTITFNVHADCPIPDFDSVVTFCTEDNEYGIVYPARVTDEYIRFFEDGQYNTGCISTIYSPVWYAMQIDHEGSLLIEMSHSELGDLDFACYGPFEGSSKREMLANVCSDPLKNFWTSWSYEAYCDTFFNDYQWNGEYSEDCSFSQENQYLYDSILFYTALLERTKMDYLQCYRDFQDGLYSESDYYKCSEAYSDRALHLDDSLYEYQLIDPRYYDTTSNCFRPNVDLFPDGKMVDCCIGPNSKEICRIENAKHGEWYLLLLSNYHQKKGNILFEKIGGEATTNCNVIVDASVNNKVCEGEDIQFVVNNVPPGATFVWTGPNGFSSTLCAPVISNASKEHEGTYSVQMRVGDVVSPFIDLEVKVILLNRKDTTIGILYGDTLDFAGTRVWKAGEYDIRVPSENYCDDIVHLTLVADTLDTNITIENNGPLCNGETLELSAHNIHHNVKFQWKGPNGFRSKDSLVSIPNISAIYGGAYYLEATYGDMKLDISPTYVDVYVGDTVELYDLLRDSVVVFNDFVIRNVGDYIFNLKSAYGCDSVVRLHVQMDDRKDDTDTVLAVVPDPYFSPNGDGDKDLWFIAGVEETPTVVKIYDRHGKMIRSYDAYSNEEGWDGRDANGHDMPSTDYWYVVSVANTDRLFVGHVALVR